MLTRRRFLGYSTAGILAAAGCRPQNTDWLFNQETLFSNANLSLTDRTELAKLKNLFLGYPLNLNTPVDDFFIWRKQLLAAGIGAFSYNNVGNPFKDSPIEFNTHDFEREIILRFGQLFAFPRNDTWGFLSNSGTDSNMHGMYMGRTLLKGRTSVMPKAYFTKEAHYSVQILRDLLGMETVFVDIRPDGSMDPDDLGLKLAANANQPALVVATIGTTFKGAIDDIDGIQEQLKAYPGYLHLDAALFGGYLPHTAQAKEIWHQSLTDPKRKRYDSIAVSCHKFFGFPSPAGLFITRQSCFDEFNELFSQIHNPEYIKHVPGTITCSRDAVKPAEFFFFSTPEALNRQAEDTRLILQQTTDLLEQMQSHFPQLQATRANKLSNTLYFRKPDDWIVRKYSLATMELEIKQKKQDYAHVVIMPHVNREVTTEFLADLAEGSDSVAHL